MLLHVKFSFFTSFGIPGGAEYVAKNLSFGKDLTKIGPYMNLIWIVGAVILDKIA